MDNNTVYLLSNGSTEYFSDNSLTNFANVLPIPFEFNKNEKWEIGLKSFGFSTAFRNISLPLNRDAPSLIICICNIKKEKQECNKIDYDPNCEQISNNDFKLDDPNCTYFKYYLEDRDYTIDDLITLKNKMVEDTGMAIIVENNQMVFDMPANDSIKYWVMMHKTFQDVFGFQHFTVAKKSNERKNIYAVISQVYIKSKRYYQRLVNYKGEDYYVYLIARKISGEQNQYYTDHALTSNKFNLTKKYPKYIKMVCDSIQPQILNSDYSKDLIVFSPDYNNESSYVFRDIECVDYIPLLNNFMTDIRIKLLDENNEQLQLKSGHATIAKVALKKMNSAKSSFNVRLTSAKSANYSDNKQFKFKVKLPAPITLDNKWKVCVNSVNHPTKFTTFLPLVSVRTVVYTKYPINEIKSFMFNKDIVYTEELLCEELNNFFEEHDIGNCKFDNTTKKLVMNIVSEGTLVMSTLTASLLGLEGMGDAHLRHHVKFEFFGHMPYKRNFDSPNNEIIVPAARSMDLNYLKPNYIMMYSNIVKSSIVAGNYSKIIKILPVKESNFEYAITEFKSKEFYELENTEINVIDIQLRSHDGRLINFIPGQDVIINLEFSNYHED